MRQDTKRVLLAAVTLCAAGCAKSDLQFAGDSRGNMRSVSRSALANAPEEKPPKILPQTHFAAGLLFERQGQNDKAILQYRKAVALHHNYVAAYHRLGLLLSATGQHQEAASTLERAVALRPDSAVLHNDLGFERMRAEEWDEAERELRRAIELQPDLATAHINLALVQAKTERFTDSLASFRAVLPEADAYYNLGLMFRGQQRYGEAVEAFRHVLTIAPEFSAAKTQLEQLAVRTQTAEPIEAVVEAPKVEPIPDLPAAMDEVEDAIQPEDQEVATVADLTAILAVLEANLHKDCYPPTKHGHEAWTMPPVHKDCDPPIEHHAMDNDVAEETPHEEIVEKSPEEETVEAAPQEFPTTGAASLIDAPLGDAPCEDETMMPFLVVPTEYEVAATEERDNEASSADEFIEESTNVAEAVELVGPPAPCDDEFEESNTENVIVALPAAPTTRPTSEVDSWAMLAELEAKIEMLRYEIRIPRFETTGWSEPELMNQTLADATTWIEIAALTHEDGPDSPVLADRKLGNLSTSSAEIDEDAAIEFVEEPPAVAEAVAQEEPTAPHGPGFEEVDADDVIVAMLAAPITRPTSVLDSWTMLEELEAKVAMLREETRATRIGMADGSDWVRMDVAQMIPSSWIEPAGLILETELDLGATEDEEFDDYDAPSVEMDEEDAANTDAPAPSDAVEDGLRQGTTPSEQALIWTTQFGELTALLAVVRNETACWEDLDSQAMEQLASVDTEWPCVEGIEQAVQMESEAYSPFTHIDAVESIHGMELELPAQRAVDRSGEAYATHQRGMGPRPE